MNEQYIIEIEFYFLFDKQIEQAYLNLEDLRYRHENRNYYTRTAFHELGFSTQGFNMEREVNDFVEAERSMLNRIERLIKRKKRFERLFEQLEPMEQNYLKAKYEQGKAIQEQPRIEQKALSIVDEMEEYKYNLTPYKIRKIKRAELMRQQRAETNKKLASTNELNSGWIADLLQDEEHDTSSENAERLKRWIWYKNHRAKLQETR